MNQYIKSTTVNERVEAALPPEKWLGPRDYMTSCLAHNDRETPNLHVTFTPDGRVLFHCFAGCTQHAVLTAIQEKTGLTPYVLKANPEDGTTVALLAFLRDLPESKLRNAWGLQDSNDNPEYPPSIQFSYMDEAGFTTAYRRRCYEGKQPKGSKGRSKQLWRKGDKPIPFGLQYLKAIRAEGYALWVEGETDALTAWHHDIPALGSPGADMFKPDWAAHVDGLDVFVWAEPDAGGRNFAESIAGAIPRARIIQPPKDIKDLSEAHTSGILTTAWLERLKRAAKPFDECDWKGYSATSSAFSASGKGDRNARIDGDSGPSSAFSASSAGGEENAEVEPPVFPIDVLPQLARTYVKDGAQSINVPADMVGVPFIAAAAASIGNTRAIEIKGGWTEPAVIFAGGISKPGTAKSPAMSYARKPLAALQGDAYAKYESELAAYEAKLAERKGKKNQPPIGPAPVPEQFITTDTTLEALAMSLRSSAGILNYRDELSGFMASMDAYRRGGDRQAWLDLWNGYPLHRNRVTSGIIHVPNPAVSVVGGIQPDKVPSLADEQGRHDGFLDRWLLSYPDAGPRTLTDDVPKPATLVRMTVVFGKLRNPKGYDGPVMLPLSPDAYAVFKEWHNENAARVGESDALAAGFYAKYPAYVGRLALILHLLAKPDDLTGPIEADTVRDAITLIEYFRASLVLILPMFHAKASDTTVGVLPRVRALLAKANGDWVDRTAINKGLSGHVRTEVITTALEALQEQGIAESQNVSTGGRPKDQWRYVPVSVTDTPAKKAEKAEEPENTRNDSENESSDAAEKLRKKGGISAEEPPASDDSAADIIDLSKMRRRA